MSQAPDRTLHLLTGCTAVGKTELALSWAEQNNAEIVSCDSLLFYRGADIGTAKPTKAEQARVPHHLVDICELRDQMDITRYVARAREACEQILVRGRQVLVVGGSGFYLKAFYSPVADDVAVPEALREELRALSLEEALLRLRALNPLGLGALDVQNPRRVVRALERCIASGKTLETLAAEFARLPAPFEGWNLKTVRLDRPPEELDLRIHKRVTQMLADGLVEEVRALEAAGLRDNPSVAGAIGYREPLAFLDGRLDLEKLESEIVRNTRALVKKQRTWFRTQIPEHRVCSPVGLDCSQLFF